MDNNIIEAIQIMFIGMAVVVIFLIILVYVMKLVSKVTAQIDKIMPNKEETNIISETRNDNKMIATAIALAHLQNKVSK